ncbi:hypothetical protein TKK_0001947 [Trichogramma kaykai]|uniref:SH3 domain-containing protein n=1 Tax=Trichogramma kaykai TaxID=54128 RepID=A0ABD2X9S3_9HYME
MQLPPPRQHPPDDNENCKARVYNSSHDLPRFSRLSRRLKMRHYQQQQPQQQQQQQQQHVQQPQLHNFERHAVQRRSMPELQKANLVFIKPSEQAATNFDMDAHIFRSEEHLSDWKPKTEFEKAYFSDLQDAHEVPSIASATYYDLNQKQQHQPTRSSDDSKKLDQNSNHLKSNFFKAYVHEIDPTELPRRIDDFVVPHSPEFHTSKERLHEIFEHNRYLRRKFFSDAATTIRATQTSMKSPVAPNDLKSSSRFGSTETLTSQSNHSGSSSTDGRKSRAEFGTTPDSLDFDQPKVLSPKLSSLPLTYFGTDRNGGTWKCMTSRLPNNDDENKLADERVARKSQLVPSVWNDTAKSFQKRRERLNRNLRKSLPNLSSLELNSMNPWSRSSAVNGSAVSLLKKNFERSVDETDGRLEPRKDLRRNHSNSCDELERGNDSLSSSVAWKRRDSSNLSHSLLELSSPRRAETKIERMIRRRGQSSFHKSCSDLLSDETEDDILLSPRLVHAASKERLAAEKKERQRRQELQQLQDTGTTLATSLYGPAPYKSPRRYVEGEVTIHYRSPVRTEAKEPLSEEELARRSAENMRRVYQEERRRKYLQELHDIDSRRHTDNFIPSQKSPIPLNRYDDFVDDLSYRSRSQEQTPEPRLVARALYNFIGQSPRELTFRRGDFIYVRRQVDKNWYEGEHNAMVGLFPFNYVEIVPFDEIRTTTLPKKSYDKPSYEGQARAKFNFVAQTNLELSLTKGELVYLLRRVDDNWYEGRLGPHGRKGIFPVSYVDVICEPGQRPETPIQGKPVASPAAHSLLSNGSSGGKLSMGPHHYTPSLPVNINATQPHYNSLPRGGTKVNVESLNEALHIDTHSEPIPYRALYNYRPQNADELELNEGDTVFVMEKCDDGWYVGSSQRTGFFGTFPGNYVERL